MNEQFQELIGKLLDDNFQEELYTVNFGGKPGKIKILPFHGFTKSQKRFWGKLELDDEHSLCSWIEIYFNGQFYRFSHNLEMEEPFVKV